MEYVVVNGGSVWFVDDSTTGICDRLNNAYKIGCTNSLNKLVEVFESLSLV
jgi:hypothetical protein